MSLRQIRQVGRRVMFPFAMTSVQSPTIRELRFMR